MTRAEKLCEIVARELGAVASTLLVSRLQRQLTGAADNPADLAKTIERVRVAVRMFVGEEKAESLTRQLSAV